MNYSPEPKDVKAPGKSLKKTADIGRNPSRFRPFPPPHASGSWLHSPRMSQLSVGVKTPRLLSLCSFGWIFGRLTATEFSFLQFNFSPCLLLLFLQHCSPCACLPAAPRTQVSTNSDSASTKRQKSSTTPMWPETRRNAKSDLRKVARGYWPLGYASQCVSRREWIGCWGLLGLSFPTFRIIPSFLTFRTSKLVVYHPYYIRHIISYNPIWKWGYSIYSWGYNPLTK